MTSSSPAVPPAPGPAPGTAADPDPRPTAPTDSGEHLAIVGMGCRLPGGADTPARLWRLLADGRDAIGDVPADRWDTGRYHDPDPGVRGRTVARKGGYIDDVGGFDSAFFAIPETEALAMDPQQRVLLEVAWEALEHAGIPARGLEATRTGVFTGIAHIDYMLRCLQRAYGTDRLSEAYISTGNTHSVAAGRIAYLLGANGPALALDTACSSGLTAVHIAAQSLRAGECDLALAGAVNLILGPSADISFSQWGMLSPTGRCRPFDAGADGYVRSEGAGVLVLKRLADSRRDGDRILAVLRGSAINHNGRSNGIVAPSESAQQAVLRDALAAAGTDPADIGMVEAHGTGTPLGDPIEFSALSTVYGSAHRRLPIGASKANLGHTECASGIVGILKTVLALRHGTVPHTPHFRTWNPGIDAEGTGLFVPSEPVAWAQGAARLGGVSSFGFSGTNGHVILESAPEQRRSPAPTAPAAVPPGAATDPLIFPVSAGSATAAAATARSLADWVESDGADTPLSDIGRTLTHHRSPRGARIAVTAAHHGELADRLRAAASGRIGAAVGTAAGTAPAGAARGVVWVFSGQGAQWAGMGTDLLRGEPAFAAEIDTLEPLIRAETGMSVRALITAPEQVTGADRVQPALFAMHLGLAAAWRAHGIEPGAVIGHSMGEIAAAVTAGALTPAQGVRVVCRRSRLMTGLGGAMAAVELPADQAERDLARFGAYDTAVAVLNAPESTVVAGPEDTVDRLIDLWEDTDIPARRVVIDGAPHCALTDPLLAGIGAELAGLAPGTARIRCYGTVDDDPRAVPAFDAGYWVRNLRRPVRFAAAVDAAIADGHRAFAEISPHPLLTQAISATGRHRDRTVLAAPSIRRGDDPVTTLRTQIGAAYCAGGRIDWSREHPAGTPAELPPTAWDHRTHLVPATDGPTGRTTTAHPLLGEGVRLPDEHGRYVWNADLGTRSHPWLADHRYNGVALVPAAAYIEMAIAAACTVFAAEAPGIEVTGLKVPAFQTIDGDTRLAVRADLDLAGGTAAFQVYATESGEWIPTCSATLRRAPRHGDVPQSVAAGELDRRLTAHPELLDGAEFYERLRGAPLRFGPAFQGVRRLGADNRPGAFAAMGEIAVAAAERADAGGYHVHPLLMDACLQMAAAAALAGDEHRFGLVSEFGRVRVLGPVGTAGYCDVSGRQAGTAGITGACRIYSPQGRPVIAAEDVGISFVGGADRFAARLHQVCWDSAPAPAAAQPTAGPATAEAGDWLLIAPAGAGQAALLAERIEARNGTARIVEPPRDTAEARDRLAPAMQRADGIVFIAPAPAAAQPPDPLQARESVASLLRSVGPLLRDDRERMPRFIVLTRDAHPVRPGDGLGTDQAPLRALTRTAYHEHPELDITHIDTDAAATPEQVAAEILAPGAEHDIALRGGARYTARFRNAPLRPGERRHERRDPDRHALAVRLRSPGDLGSFETVAAERRAPLQGEAEIRVQAVSLNYANLLGAMGMYPGEIPLALDGAGTVVRTGPGVADVRPGDRVAMIGDIGLSSHTVVPAAALLPIPARLDSVQAAALPCAFTTAWYALRHLARPAPGETVLVHAATGGVGLAAVHVARAMGAHVLATAGSEPKRALLRDLGIEHVMDSRTTDFAHQARAATGGTGVDVVLNCLTGRAQRAGLEALAAGGRFIELGKRDIYAGNPIDPAPFRKNIVFAGVDLQTIATQRPRLMAELVAEVAGELAAGREPRLPATAHAYTHAAAAFRTMAAAQHTGKLVLTAPTAETEIPVEPERVPVVRGDGAYIITGGLGAIGVRLAEHLAQSGAARLILNGRSAPGPQADAAIDRLRAAGTDVRVVSGDIAEAGTAERLVAAAEDSGGRLRGVAHAAAAIADSTVALLDDATLERSWHAKTAGAWRLHEAVGERALDWFACFSSAAALVGPPGQGAYAAANAWLDAFAVWRRAHGLPATSIAWGPWSGQGAVEALAERGTTMIAAEEGIAALDHLLRHDRVCTGYVPVDAELWAKAMPHAVESPFFADIARRSNGSEEHGRDTALIARVRAAAAGGRGAAAVAEYLSDQLGEILGDPARELGPDVRLTDLGIDSLRALELRTRIEQRAGVRIPTKLLWTGGTLGDLAEFIAESIAEPGAEPSAAAEPGTGGADRAAAGGPALSAEPAGPGSVAGGVR
ncbi:type I polyketide synthase [Streptomonospora sediminis]